MHGERPGRLPVGVLANRNARWRYPVRWRNTLSNLERLAYPRGPGELVNDMEINYWAIGEPELQHPRRLLYHRHLTAPLRRLVRRFLSPRPRVGATARRLPAGYLFFMMGRAHLFSD